MMKIKTVFAVLTLLFTVQSQAKLSLDKPISCSLSSAYDIYLAQKTAIIKNKHMYLKTFDDLDKDTRFQCSMTKSDTTPLYYCSGRHIALYINLDGGTAYFHQLGVTGGAEYTYRPTTCRNLKK